MCGLVGIFHTRESRDLDRNILEAMNERQFHRGPDEGGVHLEPGVALAHRRLSIIDLSSGQQPLFNEDRSVAIVFNGEVYNFRALRRDPGIADWPFASETDSEVVLALFADADPARLPVACRSLSAGQRRAAPFVAGHPAARDSLSAAAGPGRRYGPATRTPASSTTAGRTGR